MNLRGKQLVLISGLALAIAANQAPAAIIYSDDFDDLSQWAGAFGGAISATDDETDGRSVLADGTDAPYVEIQKSFGICHW